MKIHIRGEQPIEKASIRIKYKGNEFLIKEKADGLEIIEITDDCITIIPQVANSIVLVCKKGDEE